MAYTSSYTGPQIDEKLGLAHKQGQVAAGSGITVTKATTEGVVTSTVAIDATTIPTKTEVTTEITNAVNALDVASVGGDTKYISAISETNGKISATAKDFPTIPSKVSDLTNDSAFQTQTQVSTAITTEIGKLDKADTAVAGKYVSAVSESDGKISVTRANLPTVPTKTSDITNDSGFITSADVPTKVSELTNDAGYLTEHQSLANYTTKTYVDTEVGKKQDKLTAGTNITIGTDGKISATDTTYTAGAGISITGTVISSVASAPQFSEILGDPTDNTKLSTALAAKADASTVYTKTESDSKFRTESQVSAAISTEIGKLDKADTAVAGKYVSQVSETDGVIAVTRADLPVYTGNSEKFIEVDSSNKIGVTDAFIEGLGEIGTAISNLQEDVTNIEDNVAALESSVVYPADIKDYIQAGEGIWLSTPTGTNNVVVNGYTVTPAGGSDIQVNYNNSHHEIQISATSFPEVHVDYTDLLTIEHKTGSDTTPVISAPGLATKAEIPTVPTNVSAFTNDAQYYVRTTEEIPVSYAGTADVNGKYQADTSTSESALYSISELKDEFGYSKASSYLMTVRGFNEFLDDFGGIPSKTEVAAKQDKLTAGTGITIAADGKTISSHVHDNKTELDLIVSGDVNKWDATTSELAGIEAEVLPICVKTCAPTATTESQVLKIVRVTELPADPDPTTLYVVIE